MDSEPVKIMIVDDDIATLKRFKLLLNKKNWTVDLIQDGFEALKTLEMDSAYDLLLLDVAMDGMNGIEMANVIKKREELKDIPIIFVTGMNYIEDKKRAFRAGCVDYITKPFDNNEALLRIQLHLELAYRRKESQNYTESLKSTIEERTFKIKQTRKALIISLSSLAEFRDPDSGSHILRTREYTKELALELRKSGDYSSRINDNFVSLIYDCTPLHDIGKVGIPDSILLKKGPLTESEFKIMKSHTTIGRDALLAGTNFLKSDKFINFSASIAYSHHERYDGTGYPLGLAGEHIPLEGRIMALADVYDALISPRQYKEAWRESDVVEYIREESGKQFAPDVVTAFVELRDRFREIRNEILD